MNRYCYYNLNNAIASLPAANIKETKDNFVLELAAPGMKKSDFKIEVNGNAIHVLNAPSPAATSSLAIGTAIEQMATEHFSLK